MSDTLQQQEHILFLTGKLAHKGLSKVLGEMQCDFTYTVHDLGLTVAALMTTDMIKRKLKETFDAERIILPGRFRGSLQELGQHFGIPFERGPEEYKDLPSHFGQQVKAWSMDHYSTHIIAEIVDAPHLSPQQILACAQNYRRSGANIVDLGFMPDTPFPQLHDAIQLLKENDFKVSVDTLDANDLIAASKSGADYLLSLKSDTLWVADEVAATPIIIPDTPQEMHTLYQAMDHLIGQGRRFIADPILEPIHCGFSASIVRYHELRQRYPEVEIMMGIGNLTELTHADSAGVNALLMGIVSELQIGYVLATEVSEHCRSAVKEADISRRMMYAAKQESMPPVKITGQLMMLHERKPFPLSSEEIKEFADQIKDRNIRIHVNEQGIHIYSRDLYKVVNDPFDIYESLGVADDGGHAFYLGVELARAQIAYQLGKRYAQDEELKWGCAVEQKAQDLNQFEESGVTVKESRERQKQAKQKRQSQQNATKEPS